MNGVTSILCTTVYKDEQFLMEIGMEYRVFRPLWSRLFLVLPKPKVLYNGQTVSDRTISLYNNP